jgi:hypothetical protein
MIVSPAKEFPMGFRRLFATQVISLMFLLSGSVLAQDRNQKQDWMFNERLRAIEDQLQQGQWQAARQAAQEFTEALVDRSGGTRGDHRATAGELSGAMAASNPLAEALLLGRAAALRAIAEASVERREEARWHWYLAQNLSRTIRTMDLSPYGKAGEFLRRNLLADAEPQHEGLYDVLDPVRPEGASRDSFQEPVRTRVVYPRRPQDLRERDRFSHVVFVQVTVDAAGRIAQPVVVDGGFYPGLIYRAFEALREWRYQPATLNNKPVAFRFVVPVVFADDRPASPLTGSKSSFPSYTVLPTEHTLNGVAGLTVDLKSGVLYVADKASSLILRVDPAGTTEPFAGSGHSGFNGDDKSSLETQLNHPSALSLDPRTGELFIADTNNYRIRVISPKDMRLRTVAGKGIQGVPLEKIPNDPNTPEGLSVGRFGGDGGPAAEAELNLPSGVCADPVGILFIADSGNHRVRAVNRGTSPVVLMGVEIAPGTIETIAGTGTFGFSGDGGKATLAELAYPTEIKVDAAGNLLVVDSFNQRIRKIDRQSGIIRSIVQGSLRDVSPERALISWSTSITGVSITPAQEIIYADRVDQSIHRVSRDGENHVVYAARPRDAQFADVEVGPKGEIYLAGGNHIGVLRIKGDGAQNYSREAAKPDPKRSGVNASLGKRTE